MEVLDNKYIPLKISCRCGKSSIAWHWGWSITWRWLVVWRSGHFLWEHKKHSNPNNGYGWRKLNMGRFGSLDITYQPNMKRD